MRPHKPSDSKPWTPSCLQALWDLQTSTRLMWAVCHTLTCVSMCSSGLRMSVGSLDGTIYSWNACNLRELPVMRGPQAGCAVTCLAYSATGQVLASGSEDRTVREGGWSGREGGMVGEGGGDRSGRGEGRVS